jgi:hypothetical protein
MSAEEVPVMSAPSSVEAGRDDELAVQVVGPADGWVLERLARTLAAKLPYAEFVPWRPQPGPATRLVYYVNYALLDRPSGLIDVVFFTHPDENHQSVEQARRADACVCMARQYADWLASQGVRTVVHIPMGFDSYRFRPRLVLGVVGRLEHPRKGKDLVETVRKLPFVEVVTTEGRTPPEELRALYERLDYVLIPATVEGGPLCLLEGLGVGRPVIAPEGVGVTPEFGPTDHIRLYRAGDGAALVRVVTDCYREKESRSRLVQDRSWDRWAEHHHHFFVQLLRAKGLPAPTPALGFRFGMLGELNVPTGLDAAPLEEAVDRAARHLFFGRYRLARATLEEATRRYPFVDALLAAVPTP